ncbi:MAG: hypothetical protein M3Y87_18545 [Myxococcota bacterium]|nr:hypothetical protein [Myxococcota bacterium]
MRTLSIACLVLLAGCARSVERTPIESVGSAGCAPGAWCWERGLPLRIDGDRERGTAYAFGAEGSFYSWSDEAWVAMPVPTGATLYSAWARSDIDAWATDGDGLAWHFDGATWRVAAADGPIERVWAAPDGSVWARTGDFSSRVLRRESDRWVQPMEPYPYCVGTDYLVLDDGEVWSAGLACNESDPSGLVAGLEVRRYDGASWQLVGERIPDQFWLPRLLRVGDRVRVIAQGSFDWDGTSWQPSVAEVEIAGSDRERDAAMRSSLGCEHVYRLDEAHRWCFGHGRVYFDRGEVWERVLEQDVTGTREAGLWDTMPPAMWAGEDTSSAWGSGPTDVYRTRPSTEWRLEHYDGSRWTTLLDEPVFAIDGAGPRDVWLTTDRGPLHYDGSRFASVPLPIEHASGRAIVDAIGDGAALARTQDAVLVFDGAWTVVYEVPIEWHVTDVAGSSATDIWMLMTEAETTRTTAQRLRHFDGTEWSEVEIGALGSIAGLVTGGTETWAWNYFADVVALGSDRTVPAAPWLGSRVHLWAGPDALWLTTPTQAMSFALR